MCTPLAEATPTISAPEMRIMQLTAVEDLAAEVAAVRVLVHVHAQAVVEQAVVKRIHLVIMIINNTIIYNLKAGISLMIYLLLISVFIYIFMWLMF